MKTVGLIRVISGPPGEKREAHAALLRTTYPSLQIVTDAIEGFPHGIYNQELARKAVPAILSVAGRLAPRVDALAVSCADDPGVAELRRRYSRPVVGAGSCLAAACLALGEKVGVLTITENLPTPLRTALDEASLVWQHVSGVQDTTNLAVAQEAILRTATELVEQGCTALALACTGFSTVGTATFLGQQLNVLVLDPVLAMGAMLSASLYQTSKEVIEDRTVQKNFAKGTERLKEGTREQSKMVCPAGLDSRS